MKLVLLYLLAGIFVISAQKIRYDNYALYRLVPKTANDLDTLINLQKSKVHKVDFWTYPRGLGKSVDILVSPEKKNVIENFIANIEYKIINHNIQERIDEESRRSNLKASGDDFGWNEYHDLDSINNWLNKLAKENPDKVTLIEGGVSYENRTILGVKLSFGPVNGRKSVWIDSQMHAREWISGAVTTFVLNEILFSTDPVVRALAESHTWYFFPVINPDGFQYSHTTDRMWRKTRTPYADDCYGADPNRNWDFKWNQGDSSDDPCDEVYAGPKAFSEVETRTLSNYMSGLADEILFFVTCHSYSQYVLLPYGHTPEHLDNYNVTYPVGLKAAKSLAKRYGTQFEVGDIAEIGLGIITGSNLDWLKATYHVPFVYAMELRDTGKYGFILPEDQIIPSGLEFLDGIVTFVQEADKAGY